MTATPDPLATSAAASLAAARALVEQMQSWPWKRSGYTDDDLAAIERWAAELSALLAQAGVEKPAPVTEK